METIQLKKSDFHEHNLKKKSIENNNRNFFKTTAIELPYPHLDDSNFQKKISLKTEFQYNYNGKIEDIVEKSENVCQSRGNKFNLAPHQEFVKRFISNNTPYNGLLLFHGLGSGKTCSSIGITEKMRHYNKYTSDNRKIIIVASPNVQNNFKEQLFDETKLINKKNKWTLPTCVGSDLLYELNGDSVDTLTREQIIKRINELIRKNYEFMGYIEFSNYIQKYFKYGNNEKSRQKLIDDFKGRMIVIDEVHNIRDTSEGIKGLKKISQTMFQLVQTVKYMKLIFLTGTPMFNDPTEIIFLMGILNLNDNRSMIYNKEIFDKNGEFIIDKDGNEIGKERLIKKTSGYISYVRGEDPYSFPYLILPNNYEDDNSFKKITHPSKMFNGKSIEEEQKIKHLDLYATYPSDFQEQGYEYFLDKIVNGMSVEEREKFKNQDAFRYNVLMEPLQSLIITYPGNETELFLTGKKGLNNMLKHKEIKYPPSKGEYEYKNVKENIFSYDKIGNYSSKIKKILDNIIVSDGIVLIYSQYIDGGIIPMALALEEYGFIRTGSGKSLLKNPPKEKANIYNLGKDKQVKKNKVAKYSIVCGDIMITPEPNIDIQKATSESNLNGEEVKVILISQTGTEGIDFKNIRQIHILEPWYNMNRIQQIIGRGVRNCSHKKLSIEKRNVQLFMYISMLKNDIESIDLNIYRLAEKKSIKIGKVTRALKEVSVDCILNNEQMNFADINQTLRINLSNGMNIDYLVNDKPFTSLCDYMDNCKYKCIQSINNNNEEDKSSYDKLNIYDNTVIESIQQLFLKKHIYKREELYKHFSNKKIPVEKIDLSLHELVNNRNLFLVDRYLRKGYLVNRFDLYLFQPLELSNEKIPLYERLNPLSKKNEYIKLNVDTITRTKLKKVEKKVSFLIKLRENFIIAKSKHLINRGEDDWFKFYHLAVEFVKDQFDIQDDSIFDYMLIKHLCGEFTLNQDLTTLNHLYKNQDVLDDFDKLILKYYKSLMIEHNDKTSIVLLDEKLIDKNKIQFFSLDKKLEKDKHDDFWKKMVITDKKELLPKLKDKYPAISTIKLGSPYIGFIEYSTKYGIGIFKIKQTLDGGRKSKGSSIDDMGRSKITEIINNTIDLSAQDKKELLKKNVIELRIIEELLLMYYDKIKKNESRHSFNKIESFIMN